MLGRKDKPNAEECLGALGAVQDALYVLNGKWKIPIIIALGEGHKRFGELQKAVKGISAKVLSHETIIAVYRNMLPAIDGRQRNSPIQNRVLLSALQQCM